MVEGPWTAVLEHLRSLPPRNCHVGVITSPDIVTRQAMLGAICEYAPEYQLVAQVVAPESLRRQASPSETAAFTSVTASDALQPVVLLLLPSADDLTDAQILEKLQKADPQRDSLAASPEGSAPEWILFIGHPEFAEKARALAPEGVQIQHWPVGSA